MTKETMTTQEFEALAATIGTQDDVAAALHITRRSVGRYKRGERGIPAPVAQLLRVEADKASKRRKRTLKAAADMESAA